MLNYLLFTSFVLRVPILDDKTTTNMRKSLACERDRTRTISNSITFYAFGWLNFILTMNRQFLYTTQAKHGTFPSRSYREIQYNANLWRRRISKIWSFGSFIQNKRLENGPPFVSIEVLCSTLSASDLRNVCHYS